MGGHVERTGVARREEEGEVVGIPASGGRQLDEDRDAADQIAVAGERRRRARHRALRSRTTRGPDALDPRNGEVRPAQAEAVERVAFDLDAQQLLAVRHRAQRPGCSALGPSRVGAAAENDRAEERHERADPEPHRIKLQERASVP